MLRYSVMFSILVCFLGACGTPLATEANPTETILATAVLSPTTENDLSGAAGIQEDSVLTAENLITVSPNDIIQEIAYFGGLGGGGEGCFEESYPEPAFAYHYSDMASVERLAYEDTVICGLADGEAVTIHIKLPDGGERDLQEIAGQEEVNADFIFEYIPGLDDPIGDHVLTFSGDSWSLQRIIPVVDPDSSRLFLTGENKLIFYKFQPKEKIRLLVYQEIPTTVDWYAQGFSGGQNQKLIGWKEYQVDDRGQLTVQTSIQDTPRYVAVGDRSGEVVYRVVENDSDYRYWATLSGSDFHCPGAPNPIGVKPNSYIQVKADNLPIYEIGYMSSGEIEKEQNGTLPQGTLLRVDSNPSCIDHSWWWYVSCPDRSCNGHVQESDGPEAFLQPASENTSTFEMPACPGTQPTRLQPGMKAEVTTSGMAPQLSLRASPSMSAKKVHVIAAGRDLVVLDGSVCAENSYWWYIRSEQGFEGWAREGDNEDYWIDPLP